MLALWFILRVLHIQTARMYSNPESLNIFQCKTNWISFRLYAKACLMPGEKLIMMCDWLNIIYIFGQFQWLIYHMIQQLVVLDLTHFRVTTKMNIQFTNWITFGIKIIGGGGRRSMVHLFFQFIIRTLSANAFRQKSKHLNWKMSTFLHTDSNMLWPVDKTHSLVDIW